MQNFRLSAAHQISPNLYFDRLLLLKIYKISAKKVKRSYVSWFWRVMQIWRKTDLLFQKWQEFDEFWSEHSKYVKFDLKKYRGIIFNDTEAWCKIWRRTDLWFGKWHEEYGKFLTKALESLKIGTLMGSFYRK